MKKNFYVRLTPVNLNLIKLRAQRMGISMTAAINLILEEYRHGSR